MNPLVSIIVPVYNVERYIQECIESIQNQKYDNFEVILVDDGSKDGSGIICDKYAEEDSRIQVYHQINKGVSVARNIGIEKATGEYLMFIDSDDWIPENYISSFVDNIKDYDLVVCPIDGAARSQFMDFSFSDYNDDVFVDWNRKYILYGPHCKLYNAGVIRKNRIKFPQGINYGEDLIFNFTFMKFIDCIKYIEETRYYYRIETENSLSKKYRHDYFENEKLLKNTIIEFLNEKGIRSNRIPEYCYERVFDVGYNAIFQIFHEKFRGSFFEKYRYVRKILNDDELLVAYKYAKTESYSSVIVFFMQNRWIIPFILYGKLNILMRKRR